MTVFDLSMSYVYGGVALGCFLMLVRQISMSGAMPATAGSKPHDVTAPNRTPIESRADR